MDAKYLSERAAESVSQLAAKCKLLESECAELKKPFGTFVEYEPMTYQNTSGNPLNDWEWPKFEKALEEDSKRWDRNSPKIVANNALLKRLVDTIHATGIKNTASQWNGRKRRYESVTADWVSLLNSCMPKLPGSYKESQERYMAHVKKREEHKASQAKVIREAEQQKESELEARKKVARVVYVASQLGIDVTASEEDCRNVLRDRDKYLDLSAAGYAVRCDWNDGAFLAEESLQRFDIKTVDDGKIVKEWQAIINDFEDGRSFRDCEWNYDRIRELADQELLRLWNVLDGADVPQPLVKGE